MSEKESGQTSDPGREAQIANGQEPSGQTGVQVGRVDGVQVPSGIPQIPEEE